MKNRTKTISLLVAVCMMITLLPAVAFATETPVSSVIIGGVTLNDTNKYYKNDGTTGTETDYNAKFDSATGTLTLNGLNIYKNDRPIEVTGSGTTITLVLMGENELSVFGSNCGLYAVGKVVNVTGTGKLSVSGGIKGDVAISSGSLGTYGGNGVYGIEGNLTISGGSVEAKGGIVNTKGISGTIIIDSSFNAEVKVGSDSSDAVVTSFTSGGTLSNKYVKISASNRYTAQLGDFTVTGPVNSSVDGVDGVSFSDSKNVLYIKKAGTYTISNAPDVAQTDDCINVKDYVTDVTLFLEGVNIDARGNRNSAVHLGLDSGVEIYFNGTNQLAGFNDGIKADRCGVTLNINGNTKIEGNNHAITSSYPVTTATSSGTVEFAGGVGGIEGEVVIDDVGGSTIKITGGRDFGIAGDVTINGTGTIEVIGKSKAIAGDVTVNGSSSLTAKGGAKGVEGKVEVTGGSVICEGESINGHGIDGSLTISGGNIVSFCSGTEVDDFKGLEDYYYNEYEPRMYENEGITGDINIIWSNTFEPTVIAGATKERAIAVTIPNSKKLEDNYVSIGAGASVPTPTPTPTPTPETYYIWFWPNAQGVTGGMDFQHFTEGVSQAISPNAFVYPGKVFVKWTTERDGSGTSYTDGQVITLTEDINLYAQWAWDTGAPSGPTIEEITDPDSNYMSGDIAMDDEDVIDIIEDLLTDEEKAEDVNIFLKVEKIDDKVPADDKTAIEEKAKESEGKIVGAYLDISLFKQVGNDSPVAIQNTGKEITIQIAIPSNLYAANREYYIIYRHNGETKEIQGTLDRAKRVLTFKTSEFSTYALAYVETAVDPNPPTVDASNGIDLWYEGGNSFGSSKSDVPTSVEIDGVPVTFNGTGSSFTVGCVSPNAKWVTVRWNSTSVTTNFTPDANAVCSEINIPKTGNASVAAFALMAVIAAAGAMGKK